MCVVAALHQHAKQLMSRRRHKRNSLPFHKIDDVDKAGVEMPLNYNKEDDEEDDGEEERKKDMRMNVMTAMM